MPICSRCKQAKDSKEFYKDKRRKTGLYSSCKRCHQDHWASPNKLSFQTRASCMKEWKRKNRDKYREIMARWKEKSKEKISAHQKIYRELRMGRISKEPCVDCGSMNVHAHHEDYSKPMSVIWLCAKHHKQRHLINK